MTTAYLLIEGLHDFCRQIRLGCQLFHGGTDATMPQDEGWRFLQVGKHLERAGMTARILAARAINLMFPTSSRARKKCIAGTASSDPFRRMRRTCA